MTALLWLLLLVAYISASQLSWPIHPPTTLVHLWINEWTVEKETLLTLRSNSTQLVLEASADRVRLGSAEVEVGTEEGWRLVAVAVQGAEVGVCVVGEAQGQCVYSPSPSHSYVQVNPTLLAEIHYSDTRSRLSPHSLEALWETLIGQSVSPDSHFAAFTFWAQASPFSFKAEVQVSQLPSFSILWVEESLSAYHCVDNYQTLTSSCLVSEAIQQGLWHFMRVEVRLLEEPTVSFCVTSIESQLGTCWVKRIGQVWQYGNISAARQIETTSAFYDFRIWKPPLHPSYQSISPYSELARVFASGQAGLKALRRLQTTHYAVFSSTVASALANNFFSFENTHTSTQSIVVSVVSTGPLYLNVYRNYIVGNSPDWYTSAMDSCSLTLNSGTLAGALTVNVQANIGVSLQITVTITCNEPTAACYCPTGTYPSPTTANCVACSDLQCQNMESLGCLPVTVGGSSPSGAFTCENCPSGQFGSSASGSCASCDSTCAQCIGTGPSDCSACSSHAELSTPLTVSACVCSPGYYPSSDASNCVQCDARCTQCSAAGNTQCSACSSHASLTGSTCDCDSGYGNSATGCVSCPGLCSSCTLADANSCVVCTPHASRDNAGATVSSCSCDSGFYVNGSICSACDTTCVTCGGGLSSQCLSCYSHATLAASSACLCDPAFYPSSDASNCQPCASSCSTCSGPTPSNCLSCPLHSTLTAAYTCPCDSGYGTSALGCVACPGLCLTCASADSSQCLSCKSTATLLSTPGPSACQCPTNAFLVATGDACTACSNQCVTCVGATASDCTQCQANAQLSSPTSACTCLSSFYPSPDPSLCLACHSTCLQCTAAGPTGCSVCYSDASVVMDGSCACNDGYYPVPTVSNCQLCDSTCKSCSGSSATQCLTCYSHATLSASSTCLCDSGYGTSATGCQLCTGLCLTCSQAGASSCLSCQAGAAVTSPPAVCTCQSGYYYDSVAISCPVCSTQCLTCSGPLATNCLSCHLNASLLTSPGACQCNSYFYPSPNPSNCLSCDPSCALCTSAGPNGCSTCPANASLSASYSCNCNSGYGTSASGCQPCTGLCLTCSLSGSSSCLTCLSGAAVSTPPDICTCSNGYYYDSVAVQCPACNSQCGTCGGPLNTDCLTCHSNASLIAGTPSACLCNPMFYPSPDPSLCPSCHPSCALCTAGGLNGCSACYSNASLTLGACLCNTGFFPSTTPANCQPCDSTCMTCTGSTASQCLSCFSNASLSSHSCNCNNGYGISAAGCQPCTGLCQNCSQSGSSYCLTCLSGASVASPPGPCSCMNGYYYDSVAIACPVCSGQCLTCSGALATNCLSCKSNAALLAAAPCGCSCNGGYFPSPNPSNCLSCHPTCLTCTAAASNTCTACKLNATLGGGSCSCNSNYFFNSGTAQCVHCAAYCWNCSAGTNSDCTSCYSNAGLTAAIPSSCVCNVYLYGAPNACAWCNSVCRTCTGSGALQCLTCKSNASLSGGTCVCNPGYYMNVVVNNCYACASVCATCLESSVNQCVTCPTNASRTVPLLPSSSCACNTGFYPNPTAANCSSCNASCLTCSGPASTNCLTCFPLATFSSGSCVCSSGYYPNPNASNCALCDSTCLSCSNGTVSGCLSCFSNASVSAGQCLCNSNAFPSASVSNCLLCYYSCATCSGSLATNCLSCYANASMSAGACQCNSNAFPSPGADNCQLCDSTCLTCSGSLATQCMSCYPNAILTNGVSPSACSCPDGKYPASTSAICQSCALSCLTCSGPNANNCVSCSPTAQLSSGTCQCLSGYYMDASGNCQICDLTCLECSGPGNSLCTICPVNGGGSTPAIGGVCPTPISLYSCASSCFSCNGSSAVNCKVCFSHANLLSPIDPVNGNGRCVCDPGYFPSTDASNCQLCDVTCKTCSGTSPFDCVTCYTNAQLSSTSCICPNGFYPNSTAASCSPCDITCLSCVGPNSTDCSSCFNNAQLDTVTNPNSCICQVGYYSNGSTRNCALCDLTCLSCNGSDKAQCVSCKGSAVLANNPSPSACICSSGWYLNSGTNLCAQCAGTCAQCAEGTASDCLTCYSNAALTAGVLQGVCSCQSGYYPLVDSSNCQPCDGSCLTCSGPAPTNCLACYSNAVISVSSCICLPAYYTLTTTANCQVCYVACNTCQGPNASDCTSCFANAALSGSAPATCLCSQGFFPDSSAAICSSCPTDCKTCSSYDNCGSTCYPNANSYVTAFNTRSCRCNNSFYPNTYANNCSPCDSTCFNCSNAASNQCTQCGSNASPSAGQCPCNAGNFRVTGSPNCSSCNSACASCTNNLATSCLTCKSHAALIGATPTSCACINGYYPFPDASNCVACQAICLLCTGVNLCSSCITNASVATAPGPCACNTGFYYYALGNTCNACSPTCQTCSGPLASNCLTCFANTQLTTGTCSCLSHYYPSPTVANCLICDSSCANCNASGTSACTSCASNAALLGAINPGTCLCNLYFWPNPDAGSCSPCYNTCVTCQSAASTGCLSCQANASLVSSPGPSACICNIGYYLIPATGLCGSCDVTCLACATTNTAANCTQCKTGAALIGGVSPGTCQCSAGYYPNTTAASCSTCDVTCVTCSAGGAAGCVTCYSNAGLSSGKCVCATSYWPDTDSTNCQPCSNTCLNCSAASASSCTSCKSNATISVGVCTCNTAYYRDTTTGNCAACDSTCQNCANSLPTQCTQCKSNAGLLGGVNPGTCVCNNGYWPNTTSTNCSACNSTCAQCTSGSAASNCTVCKANAQIVGAGPMGTCACSNGFYPNSTSANCTACDVTCLTCSAGGVAGCVTCYSNAGISSGKCVCATSYWPDTDSTNCQPCSNTCLNCSAASASSCTSCKPNATISAGVCTCNTAYYRDTPTGNCVACDSTCQSCANSLPTQCTQCKSNAGLLGGINPGTCICNNGYWPNTSSANCSACNSTCAQCTSGNAAANCIVCKANAQIVGAGPMGTCACSNGFYPNSTSANCTACDVTCVTCSAGGAAGCVTCYSNAGLSSGKCVCATSYWPDTDSTNCQPCSNTCLNCSAASASSCTSCKPNATISVGVCTCNTAYYRDTTTGNCVACDSTCQNCANSLPTQCTQCKSNAGLSGGVNPGTCVCTNGYWPNTTPANCQACDTTCATCSSGSLSSNCTSCKANAQILGGGATGTCTCLDGFYPNTTSANCLACDVTCVKCSTGGVSGCTTCYSNTMILGGGSVGQCVCATSFWPNNTSVNCQACSNTCLDCSAGTTSSCTSCKSNATISVGVCTCNTAYYRDIPTGNCLACDSTCQNCANSLPTQCTQCKSNASLSGGVNPGTCVCNNAYWPNSTPANCQACDPTCATCSLGSLSSNCTSCKANAQILGGGPTGTCTCLDGFYPNTTSANCLACDVTCVKCSTGGVSGCTTCYSNTVIQGGGSVGKCVCVTSFWPNVDSTNCQPCSNTCLNCSAADASSCTACKLNATISVGVCTCNTGYYRDTPTGNCLACDSTCQNCANSLPTQCTQCKSNASLLGGVNPGTCVCNNAYWPSSTSANCLGCDNTCALCSAGPLSSNCTSCKANAQILGGGPTGTCTCLDGFYPNTTSANCLACDVTCVKCSTGGVSGCTTCYSNTVIQGGGSVGKCVCVTSFWPNVDSTNCQPCSNTCLNCSAADASSCSSCKPNATLALVTTVGVCNCNTGYYRDTTTGNCVACDSTCQNCANSLSTQCTQCKSNAGLLGVSPSSCICNSGYWPNTTSANCSACDNTCALCTSGSFASNCTSCKANAQILGGGAMGTCICLDGFYPNTTPANCVACYFACVKCSAGGISGCTNCYPNAVIQGGGATGKCVCASSFWPNPDPTLCQACSNTCQECTSASALSCSVCKANATLTPGPTLGSCLCNTGYFRDIPTGNCLPCDSTCLDCNSTPANQCNQCKTGAQLTGGLNPSTCECQTSYFPNTTPANCVACASTCLQCNAASASSCTVCKSNAYIVGGGAVGVCACLDGFWPNTTAANCVACIYTCLKCSGGTSSDCIACYPSAMLAGGLAVSSCVCISSYWANAGDTTNCQPCSNLCLQCSGGTASSCTVCKPHATLNGPIPNSCSCNVSFYLDAPTGNCPACDATCLNCINSAATQCTQCKTGAQLFAGSPSTCVCQVQFFPSPTPANCLPCDSTCSLCLSASPSACTTCQPHGFIVGGGASGICNCLGGFFPDPTPALCTICNFTCVLCSGPTMMDCTACYSHTLIQGGGSVGKCVCVSSYWPDLDTTNCQPCDNTCQECVAGTALSCSVCKSHATLTPGPATGSCPCDTGYYRVVATGNCLPCDSTCMNCYSNPATQCYQCKPGAHLISGVAPDGCICSNGFYPSPDASLCPACDPTCLLCNAGTVNGCSACYPNASITGGGPMGACNCFSNYFPDPTPAHCTICDFTCLRCVQSTNVDCIACFPHAVLFNSLLVSSCVCATSYFPGPDVTSCAACYNTCLECVANPPTSCTVCKPHATLFSSPGPSACICDINYLLVTTTGNCRTCDETCRTCSGFDPIDCTSCFPYAVLQLGIGPSPCICQELFYPQGGTNNCQPCDSTCLRCISPSSDACTQCKSLATVVFPPGKCECLPGSYPSPDPSSCLPCDPTCFDCTGPSPDQCLSCKSGADVPTPPPSLCICLSGFYPSPDASQCVDCPIPCQTCMDENTCNSCYAGAELVEGSCVCEAGFHPAPDARNCLVCGTNCLVCIGTGCLQCMPNYRLFLGKCYTKCPYGEISLSHQCALPNFLPPIPSLLVEYDNSLTVLFDTPMNCSLSATDITIEAYDNEKVELQLTWSDPLFTDIEKMHIAVQYFDQFIPIHSTITLTFLSPARVMDIEGFAIEIVSLTGQLYPIGLAPNTTSLISSLPITQYTKAMGAAGVLGSILAAILTSTGGSWLTIFNQYQIVTFLPISALGISEDFAGALAALNAPRMAPNIIANSLSSDYPSQQPTTKEQSYGINTTLFLPNIVTITLVSATVLLSYVPIYLLSRLSNPTLSTYFKSHLPALKWTVPLTIALAMYLDIGIYSLIQVKHTSFDTAYLGFNTLLGGFGMATFVFTPIFLAAFFYAEFDSITLRTHLMFVKRWKILITPFEPTQKYASIIYFSLYIVRRLALASTILLLTDSPKYFSVINSSFSTLVFLYLSIKRPFVKKIDNIESVLLESCTLLIYIEASIFAFNWSSNVSTVLDQLGVVTVWFLAVLGTIMPLVRVTGLVVNALKAAKGALRIRHLVTTIDLVPPGPTRHATFELN